MFRKGAAAQGLVSGIARNPSGQPTAGLPAQVSGQPWLGLSVSNGVFHLLAPTGAVQVAVTDLATGNSGAVTITVSDPQSVTPANLTTVATPPTVVSITPTNGAGGVSRISAI